MGNEDPKNVRFVCGECSEKMYPDKGTFDIDVGCFVKLKFTDDKLRNEYMWVEVIKADKENNKYEGVLDNDPVLVDCIECGDDVEFQKEEVLGMMR